MNEAIGYIRVSTSEQGRSGLGLEAQEARIKQFCQSEGLTVTEWFKDIQSGKGDQSSNTRPRLAAALDRAQKAKEILRNVALVLSPDVVQKVGFDEDPSATYLGPIKGV